MEMLGQFLAGTWISIQLLAISSIAGTALAVPLALARLSRFMPLRALALVWSGFFRGTPLLVQLFLFYYGLAQFGWFRNSSFWPLLRDAYPCAVLTFTLNMSAYVAEVVRGGIAAVPRGEREAAAALGLGPIALYCDINLPRALRIMLPALTNEVVLQLKATSLASTVTLLDLTGIGRRLADHNYSSQPLFVAGAIYILLTVAIIQLYRLIEKRLRLPGN